MSSSEPSREPAGRGPDAAPAPSQELLPGEGSFLEAADLGFCVIEMLFDAAGEAVDWRHVAANPAFARHTGLHDVIGRRAREVMPGLDAQWFARCGSVALTGQALRFEAPLDAGGARWLETHAARIGPAELRRVGLLVADITDRKRAEAALQSSEARLRLAIGGEGLGVWEVDLVTGRGTRSAEAVALLGGTSPDFDASRWAESIHPDDRPAVAMAWRRAIRDGVAYELEYRTLAPAADGGERWLLARAGLERDPATGRALRAAGVLLDVTQRHRAEDHRELLLHELNHRVKNILATVQSIAMQTLRRSTGPAALKSFQDRLVSLAQAHDLLTRESWEGASLEDVAQLALAAHRHGHSIGLEGPAVRVPSRIALGLAMAFHELATNSAKYGALSAPQGRIGITWHRDGGMLELTWRESGGPPVQPPRRAGFGSRMLQRGLGHELGGTVRQDFAPEGLTCRIRLPLGPAAAESRPAGAAAAACGPALPRRSRPPAP